LVGENLSVGDGNFEVAFAGLCEQQWAAGGLKMDLYSFLKSSSIVDFAFILLEITVGFLLVVGGVVMLFLVKRRAFFIGYLVLAMVPLILGVAGAGVRWYGNEKLMKLNEVDPASSFGREIKEREFPEYVITVLIGAACSAVPLLLGVGGAVAKRGKNSPA
jgi:hypothetical protein